MVIISQFIDENVRIILSTDEDQTNRWVKCGLSYKNIKSKIFCTYKYLNGYQLFKCLKLIFRASFAFKNFISHFYRISCWGENLKINWGRTAPAVSAFELHQNQWIISFICQLDLSIQLATKIDEEKISETRCGDSVVRNWLQWEAFAKLKCQTHLSRGTSRRQNDMHWAVKAHEKCSFELMES